MIDAEGTAASAAAVKVLPAPTILPAASSASKEVKVTNASAWLMDESSMTEPVAKVESSTASDDFKKFQRQNEEKKEREKAAAERAERQRKEAEAKQAAVLTEAENRRQQAERCVVAATPVFAVEWQKAYKR